MGAVRIPLPLPKHDDLNGRSVTQSPAYVHATMLQSTAGVATYLYVPVLPRVGQGELGQGAIMNQQYSARSAIRGGRTVLIALSACLIAACATTAPTQMQQAAPVSAQQESVAQQQAATVSVKTLKRKVAIGRFTNETMYGRTLQTDPTLDPLGKQASDMLATRLVQSQQFLVFERPDLNKLEAEQAHLKGSNLVGVDALILGSVTEFGRSTTGKSGFMSATKVQTAHAKVELRLVDARTGFVFFTASGTGEASTESGEVAGFGSKAAYDGSLNDRAIGAALSDVQSALMTKLRDRPWRTDILKVDGATVYISGGERQGLKVGDTLRVLKSGTSVRSNQTGFDIALPPTPVAQIRVTSLFGDNETNEGAVTTITSGRLTDAQDGSQFVTEDRE
jgi:curli biogenesis system outer membrane secretion channel CsgG